MPHVKLLTKEVLKRAPPLYANEFKEPGDVPVVAKFFTPWANWTWYMTEYDPEQELAFGFVRGHANELGYFSLKELREVRGPAGLRVERDRHFSGYTLADVMERPL